MHNHNSYRITDMDAQERPRERLARLGPQALTTAELLGILLRVGIEGENAVQIGQRLLQTFGGLLGLNRASYEEIRAQRGIGAAKAAQLKAAIELGRRLALEKQLEKPSIHSPEDAASLVLYEMSAFEQEHLRVIMLDTRNGVIGMRDVYRGSVNSSQVRIGEIFKEPIRRNATSIILVHNHPSGETKPSPDDIAVTRAIIQAGKLLDIEVLDHLIVGGGRFISLKEKGYGFK